MDTVNRIGTFAAAALLAAIFGFTFLMSPPGKTAPQVIAVSAGEGFTEIADLLHTWNLIRSPVAFSFYAIISGSAHQLKPGSYRFEGNLSIPETVRNLVAGPAEVEVLIREGDSLKDIETNLAELGVAEPGAITSVSVDELRGEYPFLGRATTFEGFLFPDTYRITAGSEGSAIVKKILDNFGNKVTVTPAELTSGRFYRDLILASLIEREVPGSEDRRLVAGVLKRRLAIGMPLQVDATVTYAKCGGSFRGCPPLTRVDFTLKSIFNTYAVQGLPPAPIANPGLDSLAAARAPRTSPYLYYISDPKTGKTVFAETLVEHNGNRARYLKR